MGDHVEQATAAPGEVREVWVIAQEQCPARRYDDLGITRCVLDLGHSGPHRVAEVDEVEQATAAPGEIRG